MYLLTFNDRKIKSAIYIKISYVDTYYRHEWKSTDRRQNFPIDNISKS